MGKPSPWEQNRCAFSSRDTSKLVGRHKHHVTTDKGVLGSSAHRVAPVLAHLTLLPNTPSSQQRVYCVTRLGDFQYILSCLLSLSIQLGTRTRTGTHTHRKELDHRQNPTAPAWRGKDSAGMRRASLPKAFKMSGREEL